MRQQILEHLSRFNALGCSCLFVPISDTCGVKLYKTKDGRDFAVRMQRKAEKVGVGPKVFKVFNLRYPLKDDILCPRLNTHKYGYVTQLAKDVHTVDYPRSLSRRMRKHGFHVGDLHGGNTGRIGRKWVCIDFDKASMGCE